MKLEQAHSDATECCKKNQTVIGYLEFQTKQEAG